jgi:hypothetical protein
MLWSVIMPENEPFFAGMPEREQRAGILPGKMNERERRIPILLDNLKRQLEDLGLQGLGLVA